MSFDETSILQLEVYFSFFVQGRGRSRHGATRRENDNMDGKPGGASLETAFSFGLPRV